jgi:fructose-bisphosphate aldolase class II
MKSAKNILQIGRAVPAFNFYNLESFRAIEAAAAATRRPVICAASESAIKYMGDNFLQFIIYNSQCTIHLDHGHTFEACKHAIALGFHSVMIDGSALPFDENAALTRRVVRYAHERGVAVEAELGVLCGREDGAGADECAFTNPAQAKKFVELTGCDWLAIAIGTSHGAYKGSGKLRFDILAEIRQMLPKTPLVLHGASQIPQKYAKIIGLKNAAGISPAAIRRAVALGINKVNVDSDARMAWTATMKKMFAGSLAEIDPRYFLSAAQKEMIELYKKEIELISGENNEK